MPAWRHRSLITRLKHESDPFRRVAFPPLQTATSRTERIVSRVGANKCGTTRNHFNTRKRKERRDNACIFCFCSWEPWMRRGISDPSRLVKSAPPRWAVTFLRRGSSGWILTWGLLPLAIKVNVSVVYKLRADPCVFPILLTASSVFLGDKTCWSLDSELLSCLSVHAKSAWECVSMCECAYNDCKHPQLRVSSSSSNVLVMISCQGI